MSALQAPEAAVLQPLQLHAKLLRLIVVSNRHSHVTILCTRVIRGVSWAYCVSSCWPDRPPGRFQLTRRTDRGSSCCASYMVMTQTSPAAVMRLIPGILGLGFVRLDARSLKGVQRLPLLFLCTAHLTLPMCADYD